MSNSLPGPLSHDIIVMTQNCRGLNDRAKLRQILKNKNVKVKNKLFILALQETYLMNDQSLNGPVLMLSLNLKHLTEQVVSLTLVRWLRL